MSLLHLWADLGNTAAPMEGPITSLLWVRSRRLLDAAGGFVCAFPLSDYRAVDGLVEKCTITFYQRNIYGVVDNLGTGIVDRITTRITPQGEIVIVEGHDLLGELNYRRVFGLPLYIESSVTPTVLYESGGVFTTLTNATDGNPSTFDAVTPAAGGDYLYFGFIQPVYAFDFVMSSYNMTTAAIGWGYSNSGVGWPEPVIEDGTIVTDVPFGQDGRIAIVPRPDEWMPRNVNGSTLYWLRADPDTLLDTIRFNEITAILRGPETSDLDAILAYAPVGWGYDGITWYSSTTNGTVALFREETILAALRLIAALAGEHFRLAPTGRTLHWLRTDTPFSGLVCIRDADPIAVQANEDVALVVALEEIRDSFSLVSRVYPFGSSLSGRRITLAETSESAPSGYTLNASDNYIRKDDTETTYGRIEGVAYFKSIGTTDNSSVPDTSTADQLFRAALAWLKEREVPQQFYRLTLTGVRKAILPGDTIRLMYKSVVDDGVVLNIDRSDLVIVSMETFVDNEGLRVVELEVGSVPRWVQSQRDALIDVVARSVI